jgi:hypothetical protein
MHKSTCFIALAISAASLPAVAQSDTAPTVTGPIIAGWIEDATLGSTAITLKAKLDTGAQTSSASAVDLTTFQRDGRSWVRFSLATGETATGKQEAPLIRWATIRRAGSHPNRRPVVQLIVCVAGVTGPGEFTLTDRSGLDVPILIGRAFLAGRIIVDPARTDILPGKCSR